MALMDKIGRVANKVGDVAGDTLEFGKAKGKIVLEKGKIQEVKESIGDYVFKTMQAGEELDKVTLDEMCQKIQMHLDNIQRLEEEAKQSSQDLSNEFK